jgi:hypothetical protein
LREPEVGTDAMKLGGLELDFAPSDRVEWLVADVSLARALFGGVPAARILARTRLASDERDLSTSPLGSAPPVSTWDALTKRVFGKTPALLERIKRQVARHTRAASDEGPLPAADGLVVVLGCAIAASNDMDASLAEILALSARPVLEPAVTRAAAPYDTRLGARNADMRAPLFEACVRLATHHTSGLLPVERVLEAHKLIGESELRLALVRPSNASLLPRDFDPEVAPADRRMALMERGELDVLLARDPRELAAIVARVEKDRRGLDTLLANFGKLLRTAGDLILAVPLAEPIEVEVSTGPSSSGQPSWLPTDWSSTAAGAALADAFERGVLTLPRIRTAVARGGDDALDAIGAEMLNVDVHPFASAAFAEILARSDRPRDIMRLVTYFAVAPDPQLAARALAMCTAPELPSVLRQWLEAMLPTDGALAPPGQDPQTSSGARLTACVSSLEPYPHLYRAVRPLLTRISEVPPPASG